MGTPKLAAEQILTDLGFDSQSSSAIFDYMDSALEQYEVSIRSSNARICQQRSQLTQLRDLYTLEQAAHEELESNRARLLKGFRELFDEQAWELISQLPQLAFSGLSARMQISSSAIVSDPFELRWELLESERTAEHDNKLLQWRLQEKCGHEPLEIDLTVPLDFG